MSSDPQVLHHSELEVAPSQFVASKGPQPYDQQVVPGKFEEQKRTICGLRASTFLLLLVLLLVTLAAGIGGGVGGKMAVNSAKRCVL